MTDPEPVTAFEHHGRRSRRFVFAFGLIFGLINWAFFGAVAVFDGRSFVDRVAVLLPLSLCIGLLSSWTQWRLRVFLDQRTTPSVSRRAP